MTDGLPSIELHEFHEKRTRYALIIGVYNEGLKFTRQLELLQSTRKLVDIIIADGASHDGATSVAALETHTRCLLINRDEQRGLSVQYRAALHYALMQGYDGVIMVDGNGKDGVDGVARFAAKLDEGYDFVQGSRFMKGGHHENTPLDRVLGIRLVFNPIMHLACGFGYTDAMNGFKACSRNLLLDPRVQPFRNIFVRYSLQYYLNYIAPRCGFRIAEIPVTRSYRKESSPQSKIIGISARLKIIGELLHTITGGYNP